MAKNKKDFVKDFVLALADTSISLEQGLFDAFRRESFDYKYLRLGGYDPRKIEMGFSNLKHRGIIKSDGRGQYTFTTKGQKWYKQSLLKYNGLKHLPWDGKWRLIIFDIPNELSRARHIFRARLKLLGFQMIQKSVFVLPYPCEQEVGGLAAELKISDHVCLIIAESLGSFEDFMKQTFDL